MENAWIEKLVSRNCSRYCQTIDAQDSEGWARCFVAEGAFEFDSHVVRGHEALREYAEAHTRVLRGRHMTLNHLYDEGEARRAEERSRDALTRSAAVRSLRRRRGY
jgi:hypothetical protein